MRALGRSILGVVLLATPIVRAQLSQAWVEYAADPDHNPNIPNVSYAGYGGGGVPLPDGSGTLLISVTSYGATGDGVTDDTAAVRAAIDAAATLNGQQPNGVTVLFPPGTYVLSGPLLVHGDRIQIRGVDRDSTTLLFTESLTDSYAVYPGTDPGDSNWSFNGGMIWFCHETRVPYYSGVPTISSLDNGFRFTGTQDITEPAFRGDHTVTVADATLYDPGQTVVIEINNAADFSTLRYLLGDGEWAQNYLFTSSKDGGILPSARSSFRIYQTIESANGTHVTFREPVRFDLRAEWDPEIKTIERTHHDVGVANLTIKLLRDYEWTRGEWHNKEPGFNGVAFTDTINAFADNLRIVDPGGIAVFMNYCKNITVNNVVVDYSSPERMQHHHGFGFANTADSIYENFEIRSRPLHGIYCGNFCVNNVYSDGVLHGGTFDYHKLLPYANVYTQIDIVNTGDSGGGSDSGPEMGARHVHWNVNLHRTTSRLAAQPDIMPMGALVGVRCTTPAQPFSDENGDPELLRESVGLGARSPNPPNLYEAQLALRLGLPIDEQVPAPDCDGCADDVPYGFDFGGLLNTPLTGQDNWEFSRDFSDIDGENTFYQMDPTYPGGSVPAAINRNGRDSIIVRQNDDRFAFRAHRHDDSDARVRFDARAGIAGGASGNVYFILNNSDGRDEGIQFGLTTTDFILRGGQFSNLLYLTVPIPSGWYAKGEWARLELRVDFTAGPDGEASLYFMNLTDGDSSFRAVPGLQNIPLLGEVAYPETWDRIEFRLRNAGAATNIVANVGALSVDCCPADLDGDGMLTAIGDVVPFISGVDAGTPETDLDGDGESTFLDMIGYLRLFDEGCP
ncbi:MAG: hypothetical protein H6810_11030 [Phycisphaeraceae bacterium]|nr:MAG: hypothetical protein H6810_11030 [Phycisphaeraceae bacterium]